MSVWGSSEDGCVGSLHQQGEKVGLHARLYSLHCRSVIWTNCACVTYVVVLSDRLIGGGFLQDCAILGFHERPPQCFESTSFLRLYSGGCVGC